jgi:mono/diheme cytochrome c family protein
MSEEKNMKKFDHEIEVDFQSVLKTPRRMFGLSYVVFLVSMVIIGASYLHNIYKVSDNRTKFATKALLVTDEDIQQKNAMKMPGVDVLVVGKSSDELVAKGKKLFGENCVSCHGDNGEGNGVAGAALNPKPRNFHVASGWTNGRKISEMYKTLEEGIIKNGMNSFSQLLPEDRFALIHYIRTFANDYPEIKEDELNELDLVYSISAGKDTKANIPIAKASTILKAEAHNLTAKLSSIEKAFENNNDENTKLLSTVAIKNKDKALKALLINTKWQESQDSFVSVVTNSLPANGFNARVSTFSKEEWNTLYNYFKNLYSI